jgi:hypothetical protein
MYLMTYKNGLGRLGDNNSLGLYGLYNIPFHGIWNGQVIGANEILDYQGKKLQCGRLNHNATQLPNAYNHHGDHMDDCTIIVCH